MKRWLLLVSALSGLGRVRGAVAKILAPSPPTPNKNKEAEFGGNRKMALVSAGQGENTADQRLEDCAPSLGEPGDFM